MAKFRDIALGPLARRAVEFPLPSGRVVKVDVVPLFGESEAAVLKEARAFAQERGIPDPKDGDELYELGRWIAVIVRGVLDPDSPERGGGTRRSFKSLTSVRGSAVSGSRFCSRLNKPGKTNSRRARRA